MPPCGLGLPLAQDGGALGGDVEGLSPLVPFYGDFFGTGDIADLERAFTGLPLRREELEKAAESIRIADYIGNLEAGAFVDLLLG